MLRSVRLSQCVRRGASEQSFNARTGTSSLALKPSPPRAATRPSARRWREVIALPYYRARNPEAVRNSPHLIADLLADFTAEK
jgi:hypothetical protein